MESPPPASSAKQQLDLGLVDVFAELADLFGNPRSHGQIYGLLFSSQTPLCMDDIIARIGISKGSASLGLRALEEIGAVERQANGRFGFYTAKRELKTLISGFVRQRLVPRLEKSNAKLRELAALLDQMPSEEASESEWRLKRVAQWHTRATQFLPLAEKLLGGKREHVAVGTVRADNPKDCPAGATRSGERESTMKQESET